MEGEGRRVAATSGCPDKRLTGETGTRGRGSSEDSLGPKTRQLRGRKDPSCPVLTP